MRRVPRQGPFSERSAGTVRLWGSMWVVLWAWEWQMHGWFMRADRSESGPWCECTYMKSISESLSPPGTSYGRAAEGNCVAVRRGGEQPEADPQSLIPMNPIRPSTAASLPGNGEACRKSGDRSDRHPSSMVKDRAVGGGWGENAGKVSCGSIESCPGRNPRERSRAAVRAAIVAQATRGKSDAGKTGTMVRSRVTTGGVKGGRKVERPRR